MAAVCLVCDGAVDAHHNGNLLLASTSLRERIERVLCHELDGISRSSSLCAECESSLDSIDEYYRHVQQFQEAFAVTALKYGEVVDMPGRKTRLVPNIIVSSKSISSCA